MDGKQFHFLARVVVTGRSRRGLLGAFAGAALAGWLGLDRAGAKKCVRIGKRCERGDRCCGGRCKKNKCRCPQGARVCGESCFPVTCCSTADCGADEVCVEGACQPCGACCTAEQCGAGEACVGGTCQTCLADGTLCQSDADCCSGICDIYSNSCRIVRFGCNPDLPNQCPNGLCCRLDPGFPDRHICVYEEVDQTGCGSQCNSSIRCGTTCNFQQADFCPGGSDRPSSCQAGKCCCPPGGDCGNDPVLPTCTF
jgi:hypothetical protein